MIAIIYILHLPLALKADSGTSDHRNMPLGHTAIVVVYRIISPSRYVGSQRFPRSTPRCIEDERSEHGVTTGCAAIHVTGTAKGGFARSGKPVMAKGLLLQRCTEREALTMHRRTCRSQRELGLKRKRKGSCGN